MDAEKNKISPGTLTYEDIHNKAEYEAGSTGVSIDTSKDAEFNEKGVTPNIGMPVEDKAESDTKSTIAEGEIEIRNKDKQKQDLKDLNRDTRNSLNKLGEIFDKESIQERQELAGLFGELAYNQIHDMKGTDEQKAAYHALVGGIMSQLTSGDFLAGASAAAVNKLVMGEIKKIAGKDPAMAQWLSAAVGAVVGELISSKAECGAAVSSSATKNNEYAKADVEQWGFGIGDMVSNLDFSDIQTDEPIYAYSLGIGAALGVGVKGGLIVTPDTVFNTVGFQLGSTAYIGDVGVNKVYVLSPSFNISDFINNGFSIPKSAYVTSIQEFNSVMKGVSTGAMIALNANISYSKTPQGYTIISYGVNSNIGASGDYSVTW